MNEVQNFEKKTSGTCSLLNTAKLVEENMMRWKPMEMECVEKISDQISNISVHDIGQLPDG